MVYVLKSKSFYTYGCSRKIGLTLIAYPARSIMFKAALSYLICMKGLLSGSYWESISIINRATYIQVPQIYPNTGVFLLPRSSQVAISFNTGKHCHSAFAVPVLDCCWENILRSESLDELQSFFERNVLKQTHNIIQLYYIWEVAVLVIPVTRAISRSFC